MKSNSEIMKINQENNDICFRYNQCRHTTGHSPVFVQTV